MSNDKGFIRRLFSSNTEQRSSATISPPTYAQSRKKDLNVDDALGIATVYRSINLISTGIMQLGLETYRDGAVIPNPLLISQPDANRSLSAFLKRTTTDLAAYGNCYWLKTLKTDSRGTETCIGLEVLNPADMRISFTDSGNKQYTYNGKNIASKRIQHLRYSEFPGSAYGLGPIQAYRSGLLGAVNLRDYSDNWLTNSGVPSGLLKTNQELDPQTAEAFRGKWHELTAQGGVAVLGNGLDFTPLLLNAADIQFIESMNLSDLQVARIFGVDPAFLALSVSGSSLTYSNRQDLDVQFLRWTLMQYIQEIEDAFTACLVRGQSAKFNVADFLRAYEATPQSTESEVNQTTNT